MGKPMQYYERSHGPLHLEDEFKDRDYALAAAKDKRQQGHRAVIKKKRQGSITRYQLWTD